MHTRFSIAIGALVTFLSMAAGVFGYFWNEAARQEANFGGVLVLPPVESVLIPTSIALGLLVPATTLLVNAVGGSRTAIVVFGVSAGLAALYGILGPSLFFGDPPYPLGAAVKASSIIILGLMAFARSRLLAAGLFFGALGDALLAWSEETFLFGAFAFLIGHLFYIALFLRAGLGPAALKQPPRALAALALIAAAFVMTSQLVPRDSDVFVPLSIYTGVLTLMALASFTLPAARSLAMAGAVLFFISDGFVAANMFHPLDDPTFVFWRSFTGWMIYWAGQAAICFGALGLHKTQTS
jgi:uncharacterized membrane protein YhhN